MKTFRKIGLAIVAVVLSLGMASCEKDEELDDAPAFDLKGSYMLSDYVCDIVKDADFIQINLGDTVVTVSTDSLQGDAFALFAAIDLSAMTITEDKIMHTLMDSIDLGLGLIPEGEPIAFSKSYTLKGNDLTVTASYPNFNINTSITVQVYKDTPETIRISVDKSAVKQMASQAVQIIFQYIGASNPDAELPMEEVGAAIYSLSEQFETAFKSFDLDLEYTKID